MNTKAKSVQVYELRLWSKKYYGKNIKRKDSTNIYNGYIVDSKTKKQIWIASAGDLLKAIDKLYFNEEKKK